MCHWLSTAQSMAGRCHQPGRGGRLGTDRPHPSRQARSDCSTEDPGVVHGYRPTTPSHALDSSWGVSCSCASAAATAGARARDFVTAQRGALLRVTVTDEGETRVRDLVLVVSAPVSGWMQRIDLEVGDRIEAGRTLIARIEPADPSFLDARSRRGSSRSTASGRPRHAYWRRHKRREQRRRVASRRQNSNASRRWPTSAARRHQRGRVGRSNRRDGSGRPCRSARRAGHAQCRVRAGQGPSANDARDVARAIYEDCDCVTVTLAGERHCVARGHSRAPASSHRPRPSFSRWVILPSLRLPSICCRQPPFRFRPDSA